MTNRYTRTNHFISTINSYKFPSEKINDVVDVFRSKQKENINNIKQCLDDKVPPELTNHIISYLRTNNIISITAIKKYLRENKSWKYDDITMCLISDKLPTFSPNDTRKLCDMFEKVNDTFNTIEEYVSNKLFSLIGYDEYCFSKLKFRNDNKKNDKIWKKICNELHWPYLL